MAAKAVSCARETRRHIYREAPAAVLPAYPGLDIWQVLAIANMIGVTESLLYAHRAGLDAEAVIGAIGAGSAPRAGAMAKYEARVR